MNGNHLSFEGNLVNRISEEDKGNAQVLELKTGPKGTTYLRFSLARSFMRGNTEDVTFLDCVVFGDQAVNLFESRQKGMRIMVEGHLNQSTWKAADGTNRSKIECVADTVSVVLRWAQAIVEKQVKPLPTTSEPTPAEAPAEASTDEAPVDEAQAEPIDEQTEIVVELAESPF